jgi:hypothetical protein
MKKEYIVHIGFKKIDFKVQASSIKEAVEIAKSKAFDMVRLGGGGFTIPKVLDVNGQPYEGKPTMVRVSSNTQQA